MTQPLREAVEIIVSCLGKPRRILEVGSRQAINQHVMGNLRNLFGESEYVGLDMQKGHGVDIVASAEKLPFRDKSFDLVFCLETLEHAEKPWLISAEIERILKPNGIAIISSPQNHSIHLHPSDYFRYTPYGLKTLFPKIKNKLTFAISPPFNDEVKLNPQHVVLVGTKVINPSLITKIKRALRNNISKISVYKPKRHRLEEIARLMRRAINEIYFRQETEIF